MQLDDDFYANLGRQLSEHQKQSLAQNIYSELEERVGEKLENQLNDQQKSEFEAAVEDGEAALDTWLDANVPNHEQLAEEVLEQLKQEATADPDKFL